jgi:transposase, IS5 family
LLKVLFCQNSLRFKGLFFREEVNHRIVQRNFVDRGYRGQGIKDTEVLISGQKRGMTPQMVKELERRSAIEPVIGHMKTDGKLGRNSLMSELGDKINALLCGAGHNIRNILNELREMLLFFGLVCLG